MLHLFNQVYKYFRVAFTLRIQSLPKKGSAADDYQLQSVTEQASGTDATQGFKYNGGSTALSYDGNGNLSQDYNKGTHLEYNEQNKLTRVEHNGGDYIEYLYDASGVRVEKKVRKTVNGTTITSNVRYVEGFVFEYNGSTTHTLSYFGMAEGRVRNSSGVLTFEYMISDHQGNVRVSFEDNGSGAAVVKQENSYYSYGLVMSGGYYSGAATETNKHLYNAGSELQDDLESVGYYSTFYREYDPVLARFNSVDPKADVTDELSIYHYAGNDPVNFNDPLGDLKEEPVEISIIDLVKILLTFELNSITVNDVDWAGGFSLPGGGYVLHSWTIYFDFFDGSSFEDPNKVTEYVPSIGGSSVMQGKLFIKFNLKVAKNVYTGVILKGVHILVGYTDDKSGKFTELQWIQTFNVTRGDETIPFVDGSPGLPDYPYYYSPSELEAKKNVSIDGTTYDLIFYDGPARSVFGNSNNEIAWVAELSLVGRNEDFYRLYEPMSTITYGFKIDKKGEIKLYYPTNVSSPSAFHRFAIMAANRIYIPTWFF